MNFNQPSANSAAGKAASAKSHRNKVIVLVVLGVVACVTLYLNVFSGDSSPDDRQISARQTAGNPSTNTPPKAAPTSLSAALAEGAAVANAGTNRTAGGRRGSRTGGEFKPKIGAGRGESAPDLSNVDPTLRMDLLAKVQAVNVQSDGRNIFGFSNADPGPMPVVPPVKIDKNRPVAVLPTGPVTPPPPPPPPPIPLKFYGYSKSLAEGKRRAFFLDGEDILMASEGETMKRRYRLVKIGTTSVEVEDTDTKSTQTLPLLPEAAG